MSYSLYLALTWVVNALSFFNMIAFLWLGFTVLLNAERRRWGTWVAGGGLILGGLFFAGHSAVVSHAYDTFDGFGTDTEFWWRASWLPVVGAPYLWYLMTAWYTGVLNQGRHRFWVPLAGLLGLAALVSLVVANPLPSYDEVLTRAPVAVFLLGGLPVAALVYPVYSTLCIILALAALRNPAASERFMGDEARRRARPWLIAASLVLLLVTLTLGVAVAVFLSRVQTRLLGTHFVRTLFVLVGFDLLICGLLAVAIVLIGRAIVSYEIFTGKALPRGGLFHYWQRSIVLAAGFGVLMGLSLTLPGIRSLDPIYRVLLATLLMTLFYALLGWRAYVDRERSMEALRPFVASQGLYERMLRPTAPPELDTTVPLQVLCEQVLDAQVAYLAALGPLAPLVGPVIAVGTVAPLHANDLAIGQLASQFRSPQLLCVPIDPAHYGGALWGIPLWGERGLIGALLLGDKRDGGLYTQEEIEIARATGERLIDARASAEMARRLMALQRQRLAETQVIDQRTRRVLHDDVLPQLHTAILQLASYAPEQNGLASPQSTIHSLQTQLTDIHRQIANLLHALPPTAAPEVSRLGLLDALRQAIEREFDNAFEGVAWHIEPDAERTVPQLPTLAAEVCFYAAREAVRNAARYGRNGNTERPLHLTVSAQCRQGIELIIEDDGVGLGAGAQTQGSGQGLGLHSTLMAVVGGTLTAENAPGTGTRITLALPISA